MRTMVSILAAVATFAISGTALAKPIVVPAPVAQQGNSDSLAPGYISTGDIHFMVIREDGVLLSGVESMFVDEVFIACAQAWRADDGSPTPTASEFANMFRTCVQASLAAAEEDNILSGNYVVLQNPMDDADIVVTSSDSDKVSAQNTIIGPGPIDIIVIAPAVSPIVVVGPSKEVDPSAPPSN